MTRRLAAAAAAGALSVAILAAGGCGGEDSEAGTTERAFTVQADTTVTTGSVPTKARFVAHVNQICRKKWKVILDNFSEYSSWQSPKLSERVLFANSVRESYLAGVDFHIFDSIYNLGAPKGQERAVEDVIGAMQTAVEEGQRVVTVPTTAKLVALFAPYNRLARDYGFTDCLVEGAHLPKTAPPKGLPPTGR